MHAFIPLKRPLEAFKRSRNQREVSRISHSISCQFRVRSSVRFVYWPGPRWRQHPIIKDWKRLLECTLQLIRSLTNLFGIKTRGQWAMGSTEGFALREEALETLKKSTTILKVASKLIEQGNYAEAERLRDEANTLRTISMLLMSEANNLERETKPFPARRVRNSNFPVRVRRQSETRTY